MTDAGEPQETARERCLDEARRIVMLRGALYRPPAPFFSKLARRWSLTLGVEVTARQVVLCLIDLKIERAAGGRHVDTVIDIAGYAACLAELDEKIGEGAACAVPARDGGAA